MLIKFKWRSIGFHSHYLTGVARAKYSEFTLWMEGL